jgi:hypothetical protein
MSIHSAPPSVCCNPLPPFALPFQWFCPQVFGAATPAQLDVLEQALKKSQGGVSETSTALDSRGQEASEGGCFEM